MRFFLELAYDGADFFGWQVQPDKLTVQGTINTVLSKILQEDIHVVGCGRTDTGVHASQYYLHFDCNKMPYDNLTYKLNSMLPDSISVKHLLKVEDTQHSRFDAIKRSYTYKLHFNKDPFKRHFSYYCFYKNLDITAMQSVAQSLKNYTDFAPLSKYNEDNSSTLCTIYSSELIETTDGLEFHISANRFLHNQIRRTIGLLILVGRGKISPEEVDTILTTTGQFKLNFVAPPEGLSLSKVDYPYINDNK